MVAIGLGAPLYVVAQALVAGFVYRAANAHDRRSPAILAVTAFVLAIVAALAFDSILPVLVVQGVCLALYLGLRTRTAAAPG